MTPERLAEIKAIEWSLYDTSNAVYNAVQELITAYEQVQQRITDLQGENERLRVEKPYVESEVHTVVESHRKPLEQRIAELSLQMAHSLALHDQAEVELATLRTDYDALRRVAERLREYIETVAEDGCYHRPLPSCKEADVAEKHWCHPCQAEKWLAEADAVLGPIKGCP